jgi:hypothetical protein
MSDDLRLPIDTAWLRANAPTGTKFGTLGWCEIPIEELYYGVGRWSLVLWRLRHRMRSVRLTCYANAPQLVGPAGWRTYFIEYDRLESRRELIALYDRLSANPW